MKISLEWLKEYLPGELDPQVAADALTHGGLNVDAIEQVDNDTVLEVEVTSNRGDCLSHIGVARELAALLGRDFRDVKPQATESADPASSAVSVRIDAPELCPHYTARVIRGVKVQPSPAWLARRLTAVGLRPINNVVDVTNYVLFEMGQPLHAFDYARLSGGANNKQIIVRQARRGEKLMTIDGKDQPIAPPMLVIADADVPVALAGVMGGKATEVSDGTTDVLLESARFDPLSVRKTARALQMRSDSSYRFERGIDPTLPERASLRAAQLIRQTAGGTLCRGVVAAGSPTYSPRQVVLRLSRMQQLLGVALPTDGAIAALSRLGLNPVLDGGAIKVTVPSWRLDLGIEADLIEEVARVLGYDKIPQRDEISIRVAPPQPEIVTTETIRQSLIASGYFEAITFSFVSDGLRSDFMPAGEGDSATALRADATVRKDNATLRPSLLPGLLEAVRRNESVGTAGARLFEIGSTFLAGAGGKVIERRRLGLVGSDDYREVRGAVESLLARLDADRTIAVIPENKPGFARGACGRIDWADKPIGYIGRIDRAIADKLSLRELPAVAELDLLALLSGAKHVPQQRALPKFPAVRRDLSLDLDENVKFDKVAATIHSVKPENLEDVEYVTTYRGKPLEAGKKSVTVTLVFRSSEGTLTSEQADAALSKVIDAAKSQLGATLRM
jgi:phenylalanyl-tRNA synthetase beta chain